MIEDQSDIESIREELTGLKLEVESLLAQNRQLEDHVQQAHEKTWSGHWEMDLLTKQVSWSDSMYDLLALSKKEQPDMKLFHEKLPPACRDKLNGAIKKTFISQKDYSFEHKIQRNNDTLLNARTDLKISYNNEGKPCKLIGNTSDITSIKSAQKELERLSLIASKTSNGVAVLNMETEITWVNHGFTLLTGFRYDDLPNKEFKSLLYAQKMQLASKDSLYQTLLKTQHVKEEVRLKTKHEDELWVLININPILDYELNPESYIVIMSDITEQKKNEQVLQEKNDTIVSQKDEVDKKNNELEIVLRQLTRAKISRKSVTITFILAILLFIASEVIIDPQIERYFVRSQELMIAGKLILALLLKPIEDIVRRQLYRSEMKKKNLEKGLV